MKFMYFPLPALPATLEDRRRERPVAYRTERWQKMFEEVVELARMAEDLGFEAITFPEHHLATEGLEIGSIPLLSLYVAMHTKTIKVGPVGYVLPGWDPLRLAVEIGWLDQLTKGRTIVGMARGYQTRWLNQMGQFLHVGRHGLRPERGRPSEPAGVRGGIPHPQAGVERRSIPLQGRVLPVSLSLRGRHAMGADRLDDRVRRSGRGRQGRTPAQDLRRAEALSEAAPEDLPGVLCERGDDPLVRQGRHRSDDPDVPPGGAARARQRVRGLGREGGTQGRAGQVGRRPSADLLRQRRGGVPAVRDRRRGAAVEALLGPLRVLGGVQESRGAGVGQASDRRASGRSIA